MSAGLLFLSSRQLYVVSFVPEVGVELKSNVDFTEGKR
jgi:hypothetical protein